MHLTRSEDDTKEYIYPCGKWFQPPVGRYLMWLESEAAVSFQSVIYYAGEPFRTEGSIFEKTLHPAGSVRLDSKIEVLGDATFRVQSLDPVRSFRPFDRRIAASRARERIRVPVGDVIAGVFNRDGNPVSLSKPQRVTQATTTVVSPSRPENGTASLLSVLSRYVTPPVTRCDVRLTGHSTQPPAVNLQTYDRIVLVWYDVVPVERDRLIVQCPGAPAFSEDVRLVAGTITAIRSDLPRMENRKKEKQ